VGERFLIQVYSAGSGGVGRNDRRDVLRDYSSRKGATKKHLGCATRKTREKAETRSGITLQNQKRGVRGGGGNLGINRWPFTRLVEWVRESTLDAVWLEAPAGGRGKQESRCGESGHLGGQM